VRTLKGKLIVFALAVFFLVISVATPAWAQGPAAPSPYSPSVGGVDTPINFMMTLAVPVLAILGIFALLFLFGRSRTKTK
jgi:uncharacterized BrkB/YihY/UPF0761 family membrane protein